MTIIQAIILGIIQGLTEFLPVSSSAHLTIAGTAMGLISTEHPEQWTAFIAVIQLGTLAAVLVYYSRDIIEIVGSFVRENLLERKPLREQSLNARMGWYMIVGTIPIATVGLALKKVIEGHISKDLTVIAIGLIALAVVLAIAERVAKHTRAMEQITWRDALFVGSAQVLALIPGPSRSGTTITAGLFVGLRRDVAARFSFLLSIPAVAASGFLELRHVIGSDAMNGLSLTTVAVATIVSGLSGYAAIAFLLRYLKMHTTMVFIVYRILLGIILLTVFR